MEWIFDRSWESPWAMLAVGICCLILGFFLSDIPVMISSQSWPRTEGMITSKTLRGQQFEEYDGDLYLKIDVYLRYQYSVGDQSYSSTRLNAIKSASYPKEEVENYSEGDVVGVYYDPRDPSRSVLEPGFEWSSKAFDGFSLISTAAGLLLLGRGIKIKSAGRRRKL